MVKLQINMTTQIAEKIYKEVRGLRQETEFLKSAVLSILRDPEGEYKPAFVRRMLRIAAERPKKLYRFTTPENFVKHIRPAK